MWCGVVTIFPDMFKALTDFGVTRIGCEQGALQLELVNPRDYATDIHKTVDDRPYGGGPGMVMKVAPMRNAIQALRAKCGVARPLVVALSPQGHKVAQSDINALAASHSHVIFVTGRYEGIDERLLQLEVDLEWSIGDYIISGGELGAMVVIDALARMLPGVLGNNESVQQDSFMQGYLDYPHYTRPEVIDGLKVPSVLLSGNHIEIAKWRKQQQLERTKSRRPDLLEKG